ncbi:VOC family protein [Roseomonas sp. HJA6]|uniref:VOC family protein n=1 Tax=Roseomonas alba TaxID=2846776 RepID=A0ABS7A742_9PROT|nr:VOC family protein [Neoroseomonas alba]MBW6397935.1 VOC family protein [Neoroseomonas alba]
MAEIDHIVIGCATLEQGARYVEELLGVKPVKGGQHTGLGTHNMLLGLGSGCYLEIIAADPDQPEPAQPRLFDLDEAGMKTMLEAEPRLVAYVASTPALDAVVARLGPSHSGEIRAMTRGNFAWRMAFPPQRTDMDNLIPPLIQWDSDKVHKHVKDSGWRLAALEAEHPETQALHTALAARGLGDVVKIRQSPHSRLIAHLRHKDGREATLTSA